MTSDEPKNAYSSLSTSSESRGDLELLFPRLSAEQIARLSLVGRERRLTDEEVLWEEGATNIPFYVVLEGSVAIEVGEPSRTVVVHEPGGFTGDVDMLSGRSVAVHARARGATRVLEI